MFVRFLFVFDLLLNLFRTALWPSVGKELFPWHFTYAVFIIVGTVSLSHLVLGQDVEFDCIGSFYLLFIVLNT